VDDEDFCLLVVRHGVPITRTWLLSKNLRPYKPRRVFLYLQHPQILADIIKLVLPPEDIDSLNYLLPARFPLFYDLLHFPVFPIFLLFLLY
jgi:hypothetical protein